MGFLRHPKTTQELRHFFGDQAERRDDPDIPQPRRKRRYIPTAWDDIWVESERCWKSYRRTQWREKPKRKKPPAKFRGHLNPRWLSRRTKKIWYWNSYRQGWYCRYTVIWYCEAEDRKRKCYRDSANYDSVYSKWLEDNGITKKRLWHWEELAGGFRQIKDTHNVSKLP